MLVEMMGREAGWIALHSGMAGDAHVILIPEIPFTVDNVCKKLLERRKNGDLYSIVVVAEGAKPAGGEASVIGKAADGTVRLGGIAHKLGAAIQERSGIETRVMVVGHIQRGGSPSEFDRILATRYGEAAVNLISNGEFGKMVALKGTAIIAVSIKDAIGKNKQVYPEGTLVKVARSMGISFGDR